MKKSVLIPVMLCFFAMGFVDLVGIASNYVKEDLALNDATANLIASLVFFWFLIFSVPTGMLMNRIGRKNTVLLSLAVTVLALLMLLVGQSFAVLLVAFSLLGIGNALLQTSLNPLVLVVTGGENLASTLTFGQFVKATASFLAPLIAMWGATSGIPSFGLGWRVLFPIYMIIGILATLWLFGTRIHEEPVEGKASSVADCFRLLGKPVVLLSFVAIMCCVGIDVGVNTTAPKVLMERLGMSLNEAAFATSLYFIARTVGCFTGSFFLRMMKQRTFYVISVAMIFLALLGLGVGTTKAVLYTSIALVGYGDSNMFSIIVSRAMLSESTKQNEVSGLMITGIFGAMIFLQLMGFASDAIGQLGAVLVLVVGALFLAFYTKLVKESCEIDSDSCK